VIPGTGCGAGAGRRPPSCHRAGWRDAAVRGGAARTWPCPARWHDGRGGGGCARHGRVSGHTGPVHAAALPVASPGGAPGTAAASPARRRSAAAAWWGTTPLLWTVRCLSRPGISARPAWDRDRFVIACGSPALSAPLVRPRYESSGCDSAGATALRAGHNAGTVRSNGEQSSRPAGILTARREHVIGSWGERPS
jgi:hypothetical protein